MTRRRLRYGVINDNDWRRTDVLTAARPIPLYAQSLQLTRRHRHAVNVEPVVAVCALNHP